MNTGMQLSESAALSPKRRRQLMEIVTKAHKGGGGENVNPAALRQMGLLGTASIGR